MTPFAKIEAVTFDAAGTLFFPDPSVGSIYQEVLADNGLALDATSLEKAFHASFKETRKDPSIADSEARERAYWKTVVTSSISSLCPLPGNFDVIFEQLWDAFAEGRRWRLNPDALDVFRFLDERAIPFGLLTNWDRRVRSVLRDHELEDRFSQVFISSEIGYEKPDPRIFESAARSLGVRGKHILHVGDHEEQDVAGARQAGWQAVQLLPASSSKRRDDGPTVNRLGELCAFIDPSI